MQKISVFINKIITYTAVLLCLIMMNYRSLVVDNILGAYTSCEKCYRLTVLNADAGLILLLVFLLIAASFFKNYFLRLASRALALLGICYYLLDIYIFKSLNQRLYFKDVVRYFDLNTINETIQRETSSTLLMLILLSAAMLVFVFFHRVSRWHWIEKTGFSIVFLTLGVLQVTNKRIDYVNDIYLKNVFTINYKAKESIDYDQATRQAAPEKIQQIEALTCQQNGLNNKSNIILLVVESLSNYQSSLHSGLNDWTPNLDRLATENTYYSNFFANNFTSLEGRIALLTAEKTFRGISDFSERGFGRAGYWNSQRSLPKLLNSHGYHTAFLDGADLNFSGTGQYMEGIGFDYVEGSEFKGYEGKPRFGFNSVADEDLYQRVINYIKNLSTPYFINVITVSTHAPYIDPITQTPSIELTTRYADQALMQFYLSLQQMNFFKNGVLIITSDHRSMTPVAANELEKYGQQAVSRIPLIVIDNKTSTQPKKHTQYLQQSDLLNSIEYLIAEKHCSRIDEGNAFSQPPKPAACIYHSRGDFRERVDVFCEQGLQQATIELNGNDTRIIDGNLKNSDEIIDFINYSRLGAEQRHKKYLQVESIKQ